MTILDIALTASQFTQHISMFILVPPITLLSVDAVHTSYISALSVCSFIIYFGRILDVFNHLLTLLSYILRNNKTAQLL